MRGDGTCADERAASEDRKPFEEYDKRLRAAELVSPLQSSLFGDSVNLYDGTTEFSVTDINLPGIGPPVQLGRRFDVTSRKGAVPLGGFGGWDIDVPFLVGTFGDLNKWNTGNGGMNQRCSQRWMPTTGFNINLADLWAGTQMHIPGAGNRELLYSDEPLTHPSSAGIGTASQWTARGDVRFGCTTTSNGYGGSSYNQGFIAIDGEGTRTTFAAGLERRDSVIELPVMGGGVGLGEPTRRFPRTRVYLMASRVEDRHGNWVDYTWDGDQLTRIKAKDGRQIDIVWSNQRIASATAHGRTWTYKYEGAPLGDTPDGVQPSLSEVQLPDHQANAPSRWTYAYTRTGWSAYGLLIPTLPTLDVSSVNCPQADYGSDGFTLTATHPAGVKGTFDFSYTRHFRSGVPQSGCVRAINDTWTLLDPDYFDTYALTTKTFSGPGLGTESSQPLEQWSYFYDNTPYSRLGVGIWPPCSSCALSKENWVISPDGGKHVSQFGVAFEVNEGRLLQTRTYASSSASSPLTTTSNEYLSEAARPPLQPFPDLIGISLANQPRYQAANKNRPIVKTTIAQQGVTFTSDHGCATTPLVACFDAYVRPLTTTQSSTLGSSRATKQAYLDNTATWVLGKVLTTSVKEGSPTTTGSYVVSDQITYNAAALPEQSYRFGLLQDTRTYHATGELWTIKDGLNQTTTLSNYKRGIPQTIGYADASGESAVVDNLGQITSITGAAGYTTSFEYDNGGRISKVTQPASDSVAWNVTTRVYAPVASAEYGLAGGHWRRTETTGNAKSITYYDARWRPVLTKTWDTSNESGTRRMVLSRFDADSQLTFASYPQRTINAIADSPDGVATVRDALGRVTKTQAASELGTLTTDIAYLGGFQKKITNPRGNATTTSFQVFDSPSEDAPVRIDEPLGTTTTISRDVFGMPVSLVRSGTYLGSPISATRRYVYDSYKRLCKTIDPESGSTVLAYDAASNVQWRTAGQSLASTSDCQDSSVPANQKTSYVYDSRNRLTDTTYGDGSPAVNTVYTADGLPWTIASDGTAWTYSYNKRRLLESESLSIDGNSYAISHFFNANGHESSLTYPNGASVDYLPNALGEATQVGTYATNITRHPNGGIAGFTYGNGIAHTSTQTARGLPDLSKDLSAGSSVLNDNYDWDENGNVKKIQSSISGIGRSRSMSYDARDRLAGTLFDELGPAQIAFTYDPLDNLRNYTTPSRFYTHQYDASTWRLSGIVNNTSASMYSYSYAGDAGKRGNVTTRNKLGPPASMQTFAFDQANRLRQLGGTASETYTYDGLGRRSKTLSGSQRRSVYGQTGKLLYEIVGTAPGQPARKSILTSYLYLNNHLLAKVSRAAGTQAVTYLHTDGLGSPVAETNEAGAVTSRTLHEPYGLIAIGTLAQGPGFTGHVVDAATGLSYMQQRYYDPVAGRFLSVDPVGADPNTGSNLNRYWYANNNPYRFTDPDGRFGCAASRIASVCAQAQAGFSESIARQANTRQPKKSAEVAPKEKGFSVSSVVTGDPQPTATGVAAAGMGLKAEKVSGPENDKISLVTPALGASATATVNLLTLRYDWSGASSPLDVGVSGGGVRGGLGLAGGVQLTIDARGIQLQVSGGVGAGFSFDLYGIGFRPGAVK